LRLNEEPYAGKIKEYYKEDFEKFGYSTNVEDIT
jgi:hypothetical protein